MARSTGGANQPGVEVQIDGLDPSRQYHVETVHDVEGTRPTVAAERSAPGGTLRLDLPRSGTPVLYFDIRPAE